MKKILAYVISGLIAGAALTFLIIYLSAQSLMLTEKESKYSFEESVQIFEETAKKNGWKIPTIHDLQETMAKFGKDVHKAKVFELCHPEHAYEILKRDDERIVTPLMPCRVAIYEKSNGKVYVSVMNTALMGSMMDGVVPKVMKVASNESDAIVAVLLK